MNENPSNEFTRTSDERGTPLAFRNGHSDGARYIVGIEGYPGAVILTVEEYNHYLDLLGGEMINQAAILTARLMQTAAQFVREDQQSVGEQLLQRGMPGLSYHETRLDVQVDKIREKR